MRFLPSSTLLPLLSLLFDVPAKGSLSVWEFDLDLDLLCDLRWLSDILSIPFSFPAPFGLELLRSLREQLVPFDMKLLSRPTLADGMEFLELRRRGTRVVDVLKMLDLWDDTLWGEPRRNWYLCHFFFTSLCTWNQKELISILTQFITITPMKFCQVH